MMPDKLKPCPFCGATETTINKNTGQLSLEVWENGYTDGETQIICNNCESRGPVGKHDKHATELWNTRPSKTITTLQADNKHMKESLCTMSKCEHLDKLQADNTKMREALQTCFDIAMGMDCNSDRDCLDYARAGMIMNYSGNASKALSPTDVKTEGDVVCPKCDDRPEMKSHCINPKCKNYAT